MHSTRTLPYVGGREYRSECSCGWQSAFYKTHDMAAGMAHHHARNPDPSAFHTPVRTPVRTGPEHLTSVLHHRGWQEFQAECRCGWKGSYASQRVRAEDQAQTHLALNNSTPTPPRPEEATVLVYKHPQGSTITVIDGVVEKRNPQGKKVSTSATAEALARGHGAWRLDSGATGDASVDEARKLLQAAANPTSTGVIATPALRSAPMRFESARIEDMTTFVRDDAKVLQQKIDGCRAVLDFTVGGTPSFRNSGGTPLVHAVSSITVASILAKLPASNASVDFSVDGEIADGIFWVFDHVQHGQETTPLIVRLMALQAWHSQVVAAGLGDLIQLLPTAETTEEKRTLVQTVRKLGGEGWMVKDSMSSYDWGSRVRHSRKVKIVKTAEALVTARDTDGKSNFTLSMWGPDGLVEVGQASAIGKPNAQVGDVVEVEYLYAGAQGRLVQPTVKTLRKDKKSTDCVLGQLVFADHTVVSAADLRANA